MKLAVVVQRYGTDIGGGSELHARYVAERLSAHADVTVLTTCARDYVSWRNEYQAGTERVNGVPVERFPVARERDLKRFARLSTLVFDGTHSLSDELRWLESQGPVSPPLVARVRGSEREFDFVLIFTIRYHSAYHSARAAGSRAVLVPTAERDASLGLGLFQPVFRGARAIMYNTPEERTLINGLSSNAHVPGVVVGIGSDVPSDAQPGLARQRFGLTGPFMLYVGRIDPNKGCAELFDYYTQYANAVDEPVDLVLIGTPTMPIPAHPRIRHLGYVTDAEKFSVIAAASLVVVPSYYESLSMAALEAWALGRPVLANGRCDVLAGQCLRSNAGLAYQTPGEFIEMAARLLDDTALASAMGRYGQRYYADHYSWPVIERAYLDMLARLADEPAPYTSHTMAPLPNWFARRTRTQPAAAAVVRGMPSGPVREAATSRSLVS